MQGGETIRANEQQQPSEWDSLNNFAGEQNLNSETGKPRTFTYFDKYPRMQGESAEDYGKRIKYIHEKTLEFENNNSAEVQEEPILESGSEEDMYLSSEFGKREQAEKEKLDRITKKLQRAYLEGRISEDHIDALLNFQKEKSEKEIAAHRQDYQDSQVVGPSEEQDRYQEWLKSRSSEEVIEPIFEQQEESRAADLDPEVQAWLNEEKKNVQEMRDAQVGQLSPKYSEEQLARFEDDLVRKAEEKQAIIEEEKRMQEEKEKLQQEEEEKRMREKEEKMMQEKKEKEIQEILDGIFSSSSESSGEQEAHKKPHPFSIIAWLMGKSKKRT